MARHVALLSVLVVLSLAGSDAALGAAETRTAGPVQATLTYDTADDPPRATNIRLTLVRGGRPVLSSALAGGACEEPFCVPGGVGETALRVADLDADGEPEVLVDLYTGGAHCCVLTRFFRWDGTRYVGFSRNFADFGYRPQDIGADGTVELVSGDGRFAFAFASFASSLFPVQIFDLVGGRLADTTARYPAQIRRDADRARRRYRAALRRHGEPRGPIAAWAADRYRLGQRRATLRELRRLARRGRLPGDAPKSQRAFVSRLDRFLRARGYGR
jgi:hypothetical protein